MISLGLNGSFPGPDNGMALEISLTAEKKEKWINAIHEYLTLWVITREQLDSLIGKLSFSQTAIFGRVGRPLLSAFYQKLNARRYHSSSRAERFAPYNGGRPR